jgi:hypothetical protein
VWRYVSAAHLRVGHQEIVSHDLHLLSDGLCEFGVVLEVVLVKWVLDGADGVLGHKRLVQLDQLVAGQLLAAVVVLPKKKRFVLHMFLSSTRNNGRTVT